MGHCVVTLEKTQLTTQKKLLVFTVKKHWSEKMREIKFRIWDKETNCYDCDFVVTPSGEFIYTETGDRFSEDEIVFEQYTGLKDKSGKEIYEGDIVKTESNLLLFVEYLAGKYVLTTGNGYDTYNCIDLNEDSAFVSQIIGNIHENLELLKGDV